MALHETSRIAFTSDNAAGAHPEVIDALAAANGGHTGAYGDDPYTERLQQVMREHLGERVQVYPVFTGTGANVVALGAMTQRWDAAICATQAHTLLDECGAPGKLAGVTLFPVPTADGRLGPDAITEHEHLLGEVHHPQPRVVTVAQATELGTVYTPRQMTALCERAHAAGMRVHVDGARIANAAASLGVPLRELTAGVDVLSLGGTKNGTIGAEAVVVLEPDAVDGTGFVRKLTTQLPSKMRFVSAQLLALYDGDLWLRSAAHANAMARRLADGIADVVQITQAVEANAVFAIVPAEVLAVLQQEFAFYVWDPKRSEVRWMCAFDTTPDHVDAFITAIRAAV